MDYEVNERVTTSFPSLQTLHRQPKSIFSNPRFLE